MVNQKNQNVIEISPPTERFVLKKIVAYKYFKSNKNAFELKIRFK